MVGDGNGELGDLEWQWSEEQLNAWIGYKMRRALAFVALGYSVEWTPDEDRWMEIYVPENHRIKAPEIRAIAMFFREPSQYGIDGGRVSKLTIMRQRKSPLAQLLGHPIQSDCLYNYDRGLEADRLAEDERARTLYSLVLEELN